MDDSLTDENKDLTPSNDGEGNSPNAGKDANESPEGELDLKTKKGFQKLVAKREQEAQEARREAEEAKAKAFAAQAELKKKELDELDETERLKIENQEKSKENALLNIKLFVNTEVQKRSLDINDPLVEIVLNTPWSIPVIQGSLGDNPTWEEIISAVKAKLPPYLDNLVSKRGGNGKPVTTPSNGQEPTVTPPTADAERGSGGDSAKRTWSRREIRNMDNATYLKHKPEIDQALRDGRMTD
jgi:hypothetical protein